MRNVRFIGLDVHAETIAVAVAESGGEVRSVGTIPNRPESVARLVEKLGKPEQLRACYEAGPTPTGTIRHGALPSQSTRLAAPLEYTKTCIFNVFPSLKGGDF